MTPALTVPVMILLAVFLAGPFILVADGRDRRQRQQMALIKSVTKDEAVPLEFRNIRRARLRFPRLRAFARQAMNYDPAMAEAYTLPMVVTVACAVLVGIAAGMFATMTMSYWAAWIDGCIAAALTLRGLLGWQRNKYRGELLKQVPGTLQFVVSAVRAGFPVLDALRGITRDMPEPTKSQFVRVVNEVAFGQPVADALLGIYRRTRVTEYAIFAVTLAVQTKSGGHLAETLVMLADTVRERITIAARARALAGEATVSAAVLTILPIVTGLALTAIRPGYLDPLFYDPRGKRLFLMGVGMLITGVLVMRKMISGASKE